MGIQTRRSLRGSISSAEPCATSVAAGRESVSTVDARGGPARSSPGSPPKFLITRRPTVQVLDLEPTGNRLSGLERECY